MIQENVLRWIAKWLEDRKQRVQMGTDRVEQKLEVVFYKGLF